MAYRDMSISTRVKLFTVLSYVFIILAVVYLFLNSPVKGYEISIYKSIIPFWVLIFIAISTSVILLVYQAYKKVYDWFWYIFFTLILSMFIILTLPISRGYYFYGGNDPTGHWERIVGIMTTGHFGDNYYPIAHILGAELSSIGSIAPNIITMSISPIFVLVFILFSYFLARIVFKREDIAAIAAALSIVPLFAYYQVTLYPHALAIFLLPIIFYLYFKPANQGTFKLLFVVILVLQSFVHVIPALILFGSLMSAEIAKIIFNWTRVGSRFNISFNSSVISLAVFFAWWSSYSVFQQVDKAYTWFVGEAQAIPRMNEVENVSTIGQDAMAILFAKMYGNQLILVALSLLAVLIILYIHFIRRRENLGNGLVLSILLLSSAIIYVIYFLSSGFATIGRFLGANYGVWAVPVLAAFFFYELCRGRIRSLIVAGVIISLIAVGTLGIYRSDWILQPNWHVTNMDISAQSWKTSSTGIGMGSGIIGSPWGTVPTGSYVGPKYTYIPQHFGYDSNHQFGDYVTKDAMIYFGEERQWQASDNPILKNSTLSNTWALPGFDDNDFIKLNDDNTVSVPYSNGEVKILLVRALKEA